MASSEELDVVRRLADDDPSALDAAFRLYAARCNAVAYRILRDDMAAEDAVQEAFLTLWRRRKGLVVRTAGIRPWLLVVTRNAALEMLRRDTRRAAREEKEALAGDWSGRPWSTDNPEELVGARSDAQRVRMALGVLSAEQRNVVESAYFRYRTLAQIAAETNTPLGTIKSRMRAALAQLARTLEPQTS